MNKHWKPFNCFTPWITTALTMMLACTSKWLPWSLQGTQGEGRHSVTRLLIISFFNVAPCTTACCSWISQTLTRCPRGRWSGNGLLGGDAVDGDKWYQTTRLQPAAPSGGLSHLTEQFLQYFVHFIICWLDWCINLQCSWNCIYFLKSSKFLISRKKNNKKPFFI